MLQLPFLLSSQTPVSEVDTISRSLERGGLYTVCAVLLVGIVYLFIAKERAQAKAHQEFQDLQKAQLAREQDFQVKLLSVVQNQTEVMTKQAILSEKLEGLLAKLVARMDREAP